MVDVAEGNGFNGVYGGYYQFNKECYDLGKEETPAICTIQIVPNSNNPATCVIGWNSNDYAVTEQVVLLEEMNEAKLIEESNK